MLRTILYLVGSINLFTGACMLLPLTTCLVYGERQWILFLISMAITVVPSTVPVLLYGKDSVKVTRRAGLAAAGIGWFAAPLFAALPFFLSGEIGGVTDCYFESVSGFTTTGSSILSRVEDISHGILMWRSMIQWLGGMGIVLVTVALFSFLGVGGVELFRAEVPGLKEEKLYPRIATVARTLWITYIIISAAETVLLLVGGMDLFDALCHTFTTMATGGFSTKTAGIAHYQSPFIHWVIIVFMMLAGTNFSLHATVVSHRGLAYFKDPEFRFYSGAFVISVVLVSASRLLAAPVENVERFIRENAFTVVSLMTTTGYANCDYELWQSATHFPSVLLVLLMFVGGMGGSTGGGMKCIRIMLLFKILRREINRLIHPRAIHHVKIGGRIVSEEAVKTTSAFLVLYILVFITGALALAVMGIDAVTSISAVAASINNIGPGLGTVGPAENYLHLPVAAKWILIICMVAGRLEVYTIVALFFPTFWKR
jgi:trk system potassium uptake protein TrkH